MKKQVKNIFIASIIIISLGFAFYFGVLQSVYNIRLDADCLGSSQMSCTIIQQSVQVSDGYNIHIRNVELDKFPEVVSFFLKQNPSLNKLLSNQVIYTQGGEVKLSTQDKVNKYSSTLEGCQPNSCGGVETSQDNGCPIYTLTSSHTYDLTGYRAYEDYKNGVFSSLCSSKGGVISTSGSFYNAGGNEWLSPRYVVCGEIKSYCGGIIYKTSFNVDYTGKGVTVDWGKPSVVEAQYRFFYSSELNKLNGYECLWKGTATGIYNSSIVKVFDIKGYTQSSDIEIVCKFDKVPTNFFYNDDIYVNDKTFSIDFTKKYVEPIKENFYRFENNQCSLINDYSYNMLSSDSTKEVCGNKIIKDNGIINIPSNETSPVEIINNSNNIPINSENNTLEINNIPVIIPKQTHWSKIIFYFSLSIIALILLIMLIKSLIKPKKRY